MFPIAEFDWIELDEANDALRQWGHRMGEFTRPEGYGCWAHGLFSGKDLVAVTIAAPLVRERVGGGLGHLTRDNTIELARLCASRPGLCRIALRMWREFVFPGLGKPVAISYQDADLHTGDTYRFDGWEKIGFCRAGGDDPRSSRKARNRNVWAWPRGAGLPAKEQNNG